MNNIQKLISELEVEKSEADKMAELNYKMGHFGIGGLYKERSKAYYLCIEKLMLLLNDKHTGAITEAAHFAKTMLSEVCRNEESSNIGVIPADPSETWLVEQNLDKLKPEE